jgi:curli production assembly/transport component CsgE
VPKASAAPKIIVAPSKKPLPPAQLEEALRLLLRADSTSQHPLRSEAEGLVLDQAISKLGHDFYDLFYSLFEAPNGVADFTIVVSERPARANASLVVLTVNDTELLELPLATRFEQLEETALYAVGTAQDYLAEAQSVSRQLEAGHKAPLETF